MAVDILPRDGTSAEGAPSALANEKSSQRIQLLLILLVFSGVFFRLFHYFDNRSLWIDEIFLGISIIKRGFWELASIPLENEQKAPLGFLWGTRLFVGILGKSDMALRLFSLLTGFVTMFAFIPVARYFVKSSWGVAFAVGIIALSPLLIYYSVEAKQYSTELLVSVLSLWLYCRYHTKQDLRSLLIWGLLGFVLFWFSFSAVFLLGGIAVGVQLNNMLQKNWKLFFRSFIPFSFWLVSLGLNYLFFMREYQDSGWLIEWFDNRDGFMPLMPKSAADIMWFVKRPFAILDNPLGLVLYYAQGQSDFIQAILRNSLLPLLLLFGGIYLLYKKNLSHFFIVVVPVCLHLLASGLKIYPFFERLTVYLAPLFIIALSIATVHSVRMIKPKVRNLAYFIPILVLAGPLFNSINQVVNPEKFGGYRNWHQREVFEHINKHYQPGDIVYVYWNNKYPHRFYQETLPLKYQFIEGKDYRFSSQNMDEYETKLKKDIQQLRSYKRVWVLYADFMVSPIGNYENDPAWFYKSDYDVEVLPKRFSAIGHLVSTYRTKENLDVLLYKIDTVGKPVSVMPDSTEQFN